MADEQAADAGDSVDISESGGVPANPPVDHDDRLDLVFLDAPPGIVMACDALKKRLGAADKTAVQERSPFVGVAEGKLDASLLDASPGDAEEAKTGVEPKVVEAEANKAVMEELHGDHENVDQHDALLLDAAPEDGASSLALAGFPQGGLLLADKDEARRMLSGLAGRWHDSRGSTYDARLTEDGDSVVVRTKRVDGRVMRFTANLKVSGSGFAKVVWGSECKYVLDTSPPVDDEKLEEVVWVEAEPSYKKASFKWTRSSIPTGRAGGSAKGGFHNRPAWPTDQGRDYWSGKGWWGSGKGRGEGSTGAPRARASGWNSLGWADGWSNTGGGWGTGSQGSGWDEGVEIFLRSTRDGGCNTWSEETSGDAWHTEPVERLCSSGATFKNGGEAENMLAELIGHWCDKAGSAYSVTRNQGKPNLQVQIWKATGNESFFTIRYARVVGGSFQVLWGAKGSFTLRTSLPRKAHTLNEVAWVNSGGSVTHTWTRDA